MRKRYFWRRACAFLVDVLVTTQIAFFAVVPFALGNLDHVRLSGGFFSWQECHSASGLDPEVVAQFRPEAGEEQTMKVCSTTLNGLDAGMTASIVNTRQADGVTSTKSYDFAIDNTGRMVTPVYPLVILQPLTFVVLSAVMLVFWRGRTVGKLLFDLRVDCDGDSISFGRALRRETLKFLPILVFSAGEFVLVSFPMSPESALVLMDRYFIPVLIVATLIPLTLFVWLFVPFIRWRGATWYDGMSGTVVERVTAPPPEPASPVSESPPA